MLWYVGFDLVARSNAIDILGDPKKPANWKEETFLAKLPELRVKRLADAAYDYRAGIVSRVALIEPAEAPNASLAPITHSHLTPMEFINRVKTAIASLAETESGTLTLIGFDTMTRFKHILWCLERRIDFGLHFWLAHETLPLPRQDTSCTSRLHCVNLLTLAGGDCTRDQMAEHWLKFTASKWDAVIEAGVARSLAKEMGIS